MKKTTLGLLALTASLFVVGALLAQSGASKAAPAPAAAPAKPQKLIKVCTLSSVQANQEFQSNIQFMQAQRQLVIETNAAFEKEPNAAKKKEIKAKLDDLLAKLNENNQKMVQAYGFSLDRTYTLAVEKADVYMLVSDEEAVKFEKAQAAAAKK